MVNGYWFIHAISFAAVVVQDAINARYEGDEMRFALFIVGFAMCAAGGYVNAQGFTEQSYGKHMIGLMLAQLGTVILVLS